MFMSNSADSQWVNYAWGVSVLIDGVDVPNAVNGKQRLYSREDLFVYMYFQCHKLIFTHGLVDTARISCSDRIRLPHS